MSETTANQEQDNAQAATADNSRRKVNPGRRRLFILISLLLPVVLVLGVEGVLRLCGFGGYPPLIVEGAKLSNGRTLYATNIPAATSYFSLRRSIPGAFHEHSFEMPKPPNTVRIFVSGGSAMKGFPQPRALSGAAFMEAMLEDVWPERNVEVINLSTTAIASYPAVDMLAQTLDYDPDLVVLCTGNNEFFGTYGVASTHAAGRSPGALRFTRWARSLAILQAIDHVMPAAMKEGDTLMELVVGQAQIKSDDPLRGAAANNLSANISSMTEACNARGVPIIVCTLPGNERDLAPIGTVDPATLDATERDALAQQLYKCAQQIDESPTTARDQLISVREQHPDNARVAYLLARALSALGEHEAATTHYQAALDLDSMPWRAPSTSNDAVRHAAHEHGATLCDLQQAFRAASDHGVIGRRLMDDHVHPSLRGQALLARSIVNTIASLAGPLHIPRDALASLPDDETYLTRLGDNQYDRYGVAHQMRIIYRIPFMRQSNPRELDHFERLCRNYESRMSSEVLTSARQWQEGNPRMGMRRPITGVIGAALLREQKFAEAAPLFDVAMRSVPRYSSWNTGYVYFTLVCHYAMNDELSEIELASANAAIQRGKIILTRDPQNPAQLHRWLGRLHQLRSEYTESIGYLLAARTALTGMELVATDAALIDAYLKTNQRDAARQLARQGVEQAGEYARLYHQFLQSLNRTATSGE